MKRALIKLLLIEDEDSYSDLVEVVLADALTSEFAFHRFRNLQDALEQLAASKFDVVVLDLTLPDEIGIETFRRVHASSPHLPIVVLSGVDDQKIALQAVREGAQDYLVKGQVDGKMLIRVIQYAMERKIAAQALNESEAFFRLISENVSDLIAVVDPQGRRINNSPSYRALLGEPSSLRGSDSFLEVHEEDRDVVRRAFAETVEAGHGHRIKYRMQLKDGSIRFIESQGNAIK